jgi:hypothetical protein
MVYKCVKSQHVEHVMLKPVTWRRVLNVGLTMRSAVAKGCTLMLFTTPTKVVEMYKAPKQLAMSCDVSLHRRSHSWLAHFPWLCIFPPFSRRYYSALYPPCLFPRSPQPTGSMNDHHSLTLEVASMAKVLLALRKKTQKK